MRVSSGSAVAIGLEPGRLAARPTTLYLLTYSPARCMADCAFCSQARRSSAASEMLSRVAWPAYPLENVVSRLWKARELGLRRVCIQALSYPGVYEDALAIARAIRESAELPIAVSSPPFAEDEMRQLKANGVDRASFSLDAATREVFERVKGSDGVFTWDGQMEALRAALRVFGRGRAVSHLIAGLGETEEELLSAVQRLFDEGVYPALFAFTPIPGTTLELHPPPPVESYRRLQLAHHLITTGKARLDGMRFNERGEVTSFSLEGEELRRAVRSGRPFQTSGCPGCNRPYYNESPRGPVYNYPSRIPAADLARIEEGLFAEGSKPSRKLF